MKKLVIALAIIISAVTPVWGKEKEIKVVRDATENRNVRFRNGGKVGVYATFSSLGPGGGVDYTKSFGKSHVFWGAKAEVVNHSKYGAMSAAGILAGYEFNIGKLSIAPAVEALYGQSPKEQTFFNDDQSMSYDKTTTPWTLGFGAGAGLSYSFNRVDLTLAAGYRRNSKQVDEDILPEGWSEGATTYQNNNWYVSLGLGFNLFREKVQYGGDNAFYAEVGALCENGSWGALTKIGNLKRPSARWAQERGIYSQWVINKDKDSSTSNEVGFYYGGRFLPWGASSCLTLSAGGQVGIGNMPISFTAETDGATFTHNQSVFSIFGCSIGGYVQANVRITPRFDIFGRAYAKYVLANKYEVSGAENFGFTKYEDPKNKAFGFSFGTAFYF